MIEVICFFCTLDVAGDCLLDVDALLVPTRDFTFLRGEVLVGVVFGLDFDLLGTTSVSESEMKGNKGKKNQPRFPEPVRLELDPTEDYL